jgi:hypothetical protein
MAIKVKRNRIPAVVRGLRSVEKAIIGDAGPALRDELKSGGRSAWSSRYIPPSTSLLGGRAPNHATVAVGLNRGRGFYSRFLEWGTVNNKANTMVTDKTHGFEPEFANIARKNFRKALSGT